MESYFSGIWKDQNFESLEYSGYQLVDYVNDQKPNSCLLYTSPSPRDATLSRMPSSA